MPPEASTDEDTRVWMGHVEPGHEAEHERFVTWLQSADAAEVFRRRRLNEYSLAQDGAQLTIVFKAPHTGDPRIMIDFLRYPGLWPEYWVFETSAAATTAGEIRVHWHR